MATREEFLRRVREEMRKTEGLFPARVSPRPAAPAAELQEIRRRAEASWEGLLARFRVELEKVGGGFRRAANPVEATDQVVALAREREVRRVVTWGRVALGGLLRVERLSAAGFQVLEGSPDALDGTDRTALRDRVAGAELGVTGVDFAVAETGSLILTSGPGRGRAVSLLPPYHVALFGRAQLVPGLDEVGVAFEALHASGLDGASITFITGPSRTADIELTLTRGVHGPREVLAIFVEGT